MASPVLAFDGLTVGFAAGPVVHEVGFEVAAGEIVAVVGESGSGKSVSARAALGLLPPSAEVSGSIRLDGQELLGADRQRWQQVRGTGIAMVFQDPSSALNPVFSIGWQLAEVLRAHRALSRKQARAEAVELLTAVGIPEPRRRLRQYPHQLSGGQQQRVVIAMALANDPRVLIADEPTTALDVTVQAEILALLRRLRDERGTSIVLITHNMGVVSEIADRVVVLRGGEVVESAPAGELFSRPAHAYTRQLLAAVPRFGGEPAPAADADRAGLELADVVVDYGGFRAVDGVSLRIGAGEVLGLVGESGSGKSTLGRVAAGLIVPRSGSVSVLGDDPAALSPARRRQLRRRIGFVFQGAAASLDPRWAVRDCIAEPLLVHRAATGPETRSRVAELLDAVQLPAAVADRRPHELSGGQRQRVGLARALALRPQLLIADEPTSALDVSVQAAVLDLLRQLQAELGFACLFITHDLAVADNLTHRVVVLRGGRVAEQGPTHQVLRNPSADYTRGLVAAVPGAQHLVRV
ncbi:ABC transporter ATP-binding protein [Saccharopolyspora indica]|uniref:dipeptide ABC transporter ATP-binding protein n=1 Tax=Saccharopolyspora indica TaxID=1229659 RepID=UPI0022EAA3CB|nr:ABC transporter ATP-binding protein [Saccharopolyspora indica]MDA3645130.1 ABC transporter ATP-binding protein [Saccharopolyspora indica]